MNIVEFAKQHPDINITVKLSELVEAIDYCVNQTQKNLEQLITNANTNTNTETFLRPDMAAKILEVNKTTLWRGNKSGYLTHIEVGGKRRYKMSDIKKILEQ
jgi:hypothetical protein